MTPPFKTFPLSFRLVLILGMYFFNTGILVTLVSYVLHTYYGFNNPFDAGVTVTKLSLLEINSLLILEAFGTIGGFMLTAMMFSVLESGEFTGHLRLNRSLPWKMILLAICTILIAQFFISYLVEVNSKIPLPASLQPLKDAQKEIEDLTNAFLDFKSFRRFLLVSFIVAVVPAIGEEMFFRGLLLGDMLKAKVRPITAIVVTGLLFALLHFEFQNTIALWLLGCFLGYLYYVSGSLWLSVTAHFVNNFLDVLLRYLYNIGVFKTDISESATPVYLTLISAILFAGCLFIFNKWRIQPSFVEEEFPNEETIA